MELHQLRTFLAIAEHGHLTRAAESLFQSQPAVSGQLRALEEELGVALFERTSRGMTLTDAGRELEEQARQIVEAARQFKQKAEDFHETVSGEIVFGLNNRPELLRVHSIMRRLAERHPDLRFELSTASSGVIQQGLLDGTVSIAFFEGPVRSKAIRSHWLIDVELCLVAPKAWARALASPDWKVLAEHPWIFVSPECSYAQVINRFAQTNGLTLNRRYVVNEDLTVLNFAAEGLAITLAAREQLEAFPRRDELVVLPHFHATVPLQLGYLVARENTPAIAAIREAVLEGWNHPQPPSETTTDRPATLRAE